ncbi:MAG: DegV family protein, partial [Pseudomonadota bacterium]
MQETAILADAACDMPRAMMDALGVRTIPFRIRAGDRFVVDTRDEAELPNLYQKYLVGKQDHYAESIPLLERELEDHLLKNVVAGCDRAILLTIASSRSKLYSNATGAVVGTVARSFKLRKDAGRSGLFDLTVIDTGAIGPGQALIVREAARMLADGASAASVVDAVENRLRDAAHMFLI